MNKFKVNDKQVLCNVHSAEDCKGDRCVIHNKGDNHLSDWPLYWRSDRQMFESICPHGVGHPTPNQELEAHEWVHGCHYDNGVQCCSLEAAEARNDGD